MISHIRSCHFTQLFQNLCEIVSIILMHMPAILQDPLFLPSNTGRTSSSFPGFWSGWFSRTSPQRSSSYNKEQAPWEGQTRILINWYKFMETLHKQNILSACTSVWGVWDCNWTVVSSGRWDHHCCPWRIGTVLEVRARYMTGPAPWFYKQWRNTYHDYDLLPLATWYHVGKTPTIALYCILSLDATGLTTRCSWYPQRGRTQVTYGFVYIYMNLH